MNTDTKEVHSVSTPKTDIPSVDGVDTGSTHITDEHDLSVIQTNTENAGNTGTPNTKTFEVEKSEQSFDIANVIKEYEQEKRAKKSYDERYAKHTFVVKKDLITRLEKVAKKHSRGFKTKFLNELLEAGLNQLDGKGKQ